MGRKRMANGEHYAMLPVKVLMSDACRTLPNWAHRTLVAIAAQYRGNNGGDLAMTWSMGRKFGITSKGLLVLSLTMLLDRGLIQKTRQGGKKPLGPTLYALTWKPIDACGGKLDVPPTTVPTHAWAMWVSAPRRKSDHRDRLRTHSGPPAVPMGTISGPPADQRGQIIGTARSPPSRSSPMRGDWGDNGKAAPKTPHRRTDT